MNPEEQKRMSDLCHKISIEQDPNEFTRLVDELNDLLDRKEQQLQSNNSPARGNGLKTG